MTEYQPRLYREHVTAKGLVSFQVTVRETDLHISAGRDLSEEVRDAVLRYRDDLEGFIEGHPVFATTYVPYEVPESAPEVVQAMARAAEIAGVGPMAAVAGAIAEFVGRELLTQSPEVIVENGGDIFMKLTKPRRAAVFAGSSPLSNKMALTIEPDRTPLGMCTSSGTVGHSVSLGKADAVVVCSPDTALADAAATAVGNHVHAADDIESALERGMAIDGVTGVVIVAGDKLGARGDLELGPLG